MIHIGGFPARTHLSYHPNSCQKILCGGDTDYSKLHKVRFYHDQVVVISSRWRAFTNIFPNTDRPFSFFQGSVVWIRYWLGCLTARHKTAFSGKSYVYPRERWGWKDWRKIPRLVPEAYPYVSHTLPRSINKDSIKKIWSITACSSCCAASRSSVVSVGERNCSSICWIMFLSWSCDVLMPRLFDMSGQIEKPTRVKITCKNWLLISSISSGWKPISINLANPTASSVPSDVLLMIFWRKDWGNNLGEGCEFFEPMEQWRVRESGRTNMLFNGTVSPIIRPFMIKRTNLVRGSSPYAVRTYTICKKTRQT